jgi:hypothetical protein
LDNEKGKILRDNLDNYVFRPRSFGIVNDKNVNLTEILTFDAILKEDDSFIILY